MTQHLDTIGAEMVRRLLSGSDVLAEGRQGWNRLRLAAASSDETETQQCDDGLQH